MASPEQHVPSTGSEDPAAEGAPHGRAGLHRSDAMDTEGKPAILMPAGL